MRIAMNAVALSAALCTAAMTAGAAAETFTGSGFLIGANGEVLTNAHVVEACRTITLTFADGHAEPGTLLARDAKNDVALVRTTRAHKAGSAVAVFREGPPLRPGDTIVALGYPLSGMLATGANLSVGNVSALAGLGDDSRFIQISAPVQPGNSGGPLVDASAHVVGIVTAKLNAVKVAEFTGDIPQNVNFALKDEVARTFLDSKLVSYKTEKSTARLSPADVGQIARPFTVHVTCIQAERQEASAAPAAKTDTPTGNLTGEVRDAFVKRARNSCTRKVYKQYPNVPRPNLRAYCSCLAEGEADTISPSDVDYINKHRQASDNFKARVAKLLAACKNKAELQ